MSEDIALKKWGVKHRRYLHQHPELALQEKNTSAYCKKIFKSLGYILHDCWGYGFIADLDIPRTTKKIAFRADMDALPMQEKNTHDFVSKNFGIAHMCGHDVHMAIALSAAKLIEENKKDLKASVRFIFQPSEEKPPGGAVGMIKNGCLDGISEIYGLHNTAALPVGQMALREGTFFAANAEFEVTIIGKGCHAARPQDGLNPIPAAAKLIDIWQYIPAKINAAQLPVLTVAQCLAGEAVNVIPETAKLIGIMRSLNQGELIKIQDLMTESMQQLEAQGYTFKFDINPGYSCVINSAYGVKRVVDAAAKIVNNINANCEAVMVSEDFSYYLEKIPGAFFFLGSGNAAKNITAEIHSPYYDVDEDVIPIGAEIFTQLALLNPPNPPLIKGGYD